MKEKKNAIITLRTTDTVKDFLEQEAADRGWTTSQLAESIIARYASSGETRKRDAVEASEAGKILRYIAETNCKSFKELTKWAIEQDLMETFQLSVPIWQAILEENQETFNN